MKSIDWTKGLEIIANATGTWVVHVSNADVDKPEWKVAVDALIDKYGRDLATDILIHEYDASFANSDEARALIEIIDPAVDYWCLVSPTDGIVHEK